jgi:hypothetical protein
MDAQAAVCVAEAMLDCTKQSVSHNFGRRERKAFVRNCMGLPERSNRPQRRKGKDQ